MKISRVLSYLFESNTRVIPIIGVLLLAIAVPITLNVVQQNQDNRQQASGPLVTTQDTVTAPSSCAEAQGDCVREDNTKPEFSCFGVAKDDKTPLCNHPNLVCCIKKSPSQENSTCIAEGKSCDYKDVTECESSRGVGNCEEASNYTCINHNVCITVSETASPSASPSPSQTPAKGELCPDGSSNFSCGFATSDTHCPVCSPTSACTSDNYSIASCSSGGGCTQDSDCAGLPVSCPAGTTGTVACVQNICKTMNCK